MDFFSAKTVIKFHFQQTYLSEHSLDNAAFEGSDFIINEVKKFTVDKTTLEMKL